MEFGDLHEWGLTVAQARALQDGLAARVRLRPLPARIRLVAGADVAFPSRQSVVAAVVVLALPELGLVETVTVHRPCPFPYVPGLLSMREGPSLVDAFRQLRSRPDAVIFDGQGIAHPRRVGLASHIGLWLGLPTVGCAKSRLLGEHAEPGQERGESAALLVDGEQVGVVLRTRTGVRPVYVSPGHLADVTSARQLVLQCCTRYRLPEPTRLADQEAGHASEQRRLGR
jgi:deoxyribonuclease V